MFGLVHALVLLIDIDDDFEKAMLKLPFKIMIKKNVQLPYLLEWQDVISRGKQQ